jgi:hypothetical protein
MGRRHAGSDPWQERGSVMRPPLGGRVEAQRGVLLDLARLVMEVTRGADTVVAGCSCAAALLLPAWCAVVKGGAAVRSR